MSNNDTAQAILAVISQIPIGSVISYGDASKRAGLPGYARYVGYVLRNLPEHSNIPWHRVMNSKGLISFPSDSGKYSEQRSRLESEGIKFSVSGSVKLTSYTW